MGKATARKITAPVKAATVAKPISVTKPVRKVAAPVTVTNTGKDRFKATTAVQVPAPAKPPAEPKPKPIRVEHNVTSLYTGESTGLNKRKSRTVLDLGLFGTKPDYVLSERSELIAETIKKEYGNKPFPRANLDAGVLKHLLIKGFIEAVSGTGGEDTTLRFTKAGLAYHRNA